LTRCPSKWVFTVGAILCLAIALPLSVLSLIIGGQVVMPLVYFLNLRGIGVLLLVLASASVAFILTAIVVLLLSITILATFVLIRFNLKCRGWMLIYSVRHKLLVNHLRAYRDRPETGDYHAEYRIALYNRRIGNSIRAEQHLLAALNLARYSKRDDMVFGLNIELAKFYRGRKQYSKAEEYLTNARKQFALSRHVSSRLATSLMLEHGYYLIEIRKYSEALLATLRCLLQYSGNRKTRGEALNCIGLALAFSGYRAKARDYFATAATLTTGSGKLKCLLNRARCDLALRQFHAVYQAMAEAKCVAQPSNRAALKIIFDFYALLPWEILHCVLPHYTFERSIGDLMRGVESQYSAAVVTQEYDPALSRLFHYAGAYMAERSASIIEKQALTSPQLSRILWMAKQPQSYARIWWESLGYTLDALAVESRHKSKFHQSIKSVLLYSSALPALAGKMRRRGQQLSGFGIDNRAFDFRNYSKAPLHVIRQLATHARRAFRELKSKIEVTELDMLRSGLLAVYSEAANALAALSIECFTRSKNRDDLESAWTALRAAHSCQLRDLHKNANEGIAEVKLERPFSDTIDMIRQQMAEGAVCGIGKKERDSLEEYIAHILARAPRPFTAASEKLIEFQELLTDNVLVVIFIVQGDNSFVCRVTKQTAVTSRLPSCDILKSLTAKANELVSRKPMSLAHVEDADGEAAAASLSHMIFGEFISSTISRIAIVPDGPSWELPIEVLPCPGAEERKAPLGARYEVVWSVGLDDPSFSRPLDIPSGKLTVALIGDPVYDLADDRFPSRDSSTLSVADLSLARLLYSAEEINAVRRRLQKYASVKSFSGFDASISTAVDCLSKCDLVHLSCHASEDQNRTLYLSDYQPNRQNINGKWRANEISHNNFSAKLIVLSACATGVGQIERGDCPCSLGRAFLAAGVEASIVTSWPISDEGTSVFMQKFYDFLFKRRSSAGNIPGALRCARRAMINAPEWRHPYFWASYKLMISGIFSQ
jgi:CHAT domain